ncbi:MULTISPECIES: EI24 domain-containing protein [unclassified Leptolyngbya]|uniref:EI24 domain-containing protein n=1 Tax=unclassified Leptolyngbya TaxID=2650499 RepID=UPI0016847A19|nr:MULTISPECIES: EI24 domain-containing protein [unclassified Leptolyngbya]MBD1912154.1 EI24 domain-containing protein [Leptolyngbya sp. FACHB-8]MBD2155045.1 EI24 domain-containing protein [Leptolyngbya sp. FACHB-16]
MNNGLMRIPAGLLAGIVYPLRALWLLIQTPPLRRYVLIPIAINFALGITLYAALITGGLRLVDAIALDIPHWTAQIPAWADTLPDWHFTFPAWMTHVPAWFPHWPASWHVSWPTWLNPSNWSIPWPQWSFSWRPALPNWFAEIPDWLAIALLWVVRLVLTLVLLLVTGFILLQFGVLLGAPWYGKLSEELEKRQTGQVTIVEVGVARDIGRAILYELKKLVLSLGVGVPLFVLGFVPLVAAIATPLSIALAGTIVCLDFLDSALERRRLRFREKLGVFIRTLPASASFGLVCLVLVSVPLVNLLAIPVCVTAGTLFFCDWVYPWMKERDLAIVDKSAAALSESAVEQNLD